jgi:hypothetical protein
VYTSSERRIWGEDEAGGAGWGRGIRRPAGGDHQRRLVPNSETDGDLAGARLRHRERTL